MAIEHAEPLKSAQINVCYSEDALWSIQVTLAYEKYVIDY